MKDKRNILGLDLGTNSIGWCVISESNACSETEQVRKIEDAGCRIIPMDAAMQSDFAKGNTISQTADRTSSRGSRRLRERSLLRRCRLLRVLNVMEFLPSHYAASLTRYGRFRNHEECKLAWAVGEAGRPYFLFKQSYDEMLQLFWQLHPELLSNGLKVPYDWTLYYLRHKALSQPITPQELAWLLLSFNQKRGYYQARGEEERDDRSKKEEYYKLKVVDVVDTHTKKGKATWYDVILENGMVYHRAADVAPDWIGKTKEFIVTTALEADGQPKLDKDGQPKRSFRMPGDDDWGLLKIKTQADIRTSGKTVGAYIFNALLANPKQKVRGKLVRTIERDFYRDEIVKILEAQKRFMPQLTDPALYLDCITELYPSNEAYRASIAQRDFTYLLVDDILFYQRPLKSKKSLIAECPYESHVFVGPDGQPEQRFVKCIAKSHPLYQEFRLWEFLSHLRIYKSEVDASGRLMDDCDVTAQFLPDDDAYVALFNYLNNLPSIKQKDLLGKYFKIKKPKGADAELPYRWNYVQDKEYPCNETRGEILMRLKKAGVDASFLTPHEEERLWHILYSVSDRKELRKALQRYADSHALGQEFVEVMAKHPPYASDYGAYSAKAIKKLLPLMRRGSYWRADHIDPATLVRIQRIIDGEVDDTISERVRLKAMSLTTLEHYRGLPQWLACYIVYGRHSEARDAQRWTHPDDIDRYLANFRQFSLRNPVVEQVVTETLRVVRDIWRVHGHLDEIHIEIGRDLKNPADKRKQMAQKAVDNENTNLRIKALLAEFLNPEFGIQEVRPYSPSQQETLRVYEDVVLHSVDAIPDDIADIMKALSQADAVKRPSHKQVQTYLDWLQDNYVSPYTGQTIPLARLFTRDYEIEHIIPQSRYFDDSLSNKVICEAAVNKLKDNALGYEFIKKHHGEVVEVGENRRVTIYEVDAYCDHVQKAYKHNRAKMKKLLMDDIPDDFIERQLNDSRYISKFVKNLLSHIVREENEQETTSKHLVVCPGSVTDRLKREWGVSDVWNSIILPRFERMNQVTGTTHFTTVSSSGHTIPDMPLHLQKGFSKKRIDHRHHAMDAIVIACTTREHVNLLSNEAALSRTNANRYQLSRKLRRYEDTLIMRNGEARKVSVAKEFNMPWPTFKSDLHQALQQVIVSFKQNLRIIGKTSNYTSRFVDGVKKMVKQTKGDHWAIRKSMHKDTVFGEINLRGVKTATLADAMQRPERIVSTSLKAKVRELLSLGYSPAQAKRYFDDHNDEWPEFNTRKIEVYYFSCETSTHVYATRKPLDTSFTEAAIKGKVADTGIQQILLRHLAACQGDPEKAFSPDGIDAMNQHIRSLNGGRFHQPIFKVRVYERAEKFAVGTVGNKKHKFVEAAKGTNLFFAVTEEETLNKTTGLPEKTRRFRTIPLAEAIQKMKAGQPLDAQATFILSPNDLVYVPTEQELADGCIASPLNTSRIYKMVSASGVECYFVPFCVASPIVDKVEFSRLNKMERAVTDEMIKRVCIPLTVDRLGRIIKIGV